MPHLFLFQDPMIIGFKWLASTAIYWWPPLSIYLFWKFYLIYIRSRWIKDAPRVLLEIKMPKVITKSPAAMEVIFAVMHQTSVGSLIDQYVKGRVHSVFALELASFGGEIHFFIWSERKYKDLLEATIYSQYPDIEIYEVDDYVNRVPYGMPGSNWDFWGIEYGLSKADPYPIKTYVDFGMDKDPKEELKIDPMTSLLELLGSMGPGEQMWMQVVIRSSQKQYPVPGKIFAKENWQKQALRLVETLMHRDSKETDLSKAWSKTILSPGERAAVEAVERSYGKYGYDTGIRILYLAEKDNFKGINIPRLLIAMKPFGTQHLNSFKTVLTTSFDYPWEDFMGKRLAYRKWQFFDFYRRRAYFYLPAVRNYFILNSEELATVYHFPGQVASTPTLERIGSKKAEPPANLPGA